MHSSIQSYTQFWHPRERYENKVLYFSSVNELDLATPQDLLLWSQPALYYALAFLFFGYVVNLPLSFISTLQAIATIFTLSEMLSSHFDLRLDSDSSQRILLSQFYGEVYILENCPKYIMLFTHTPSPCIKATFGSAKKLWYAKLVLVNCCHPILTLDWIPTAANAYFYRRFLVRF